MLRIEAILRRAQDRPQASGPLSLGHCSFDPDRGELICEGEPVRLTEAEVALLRQLARTPHEAVERLELARDTVDPFRAGRGRPGHLGYGAEIETDPKSPRYLQTVRGVGYAVLKKPRIDERAHQSSTPRLRGPVVPSPAAQGRQVMARRPRVFGRWIKRQMPKTLFGRSLLIIVLPVAIMQIAVTYVFFDAHWQTVTSRLSEGLAGDIAWAVESLSGRPHARRLRPAVEAGRGLYEPLDRPAAGTQAARRTARGADAGRAVSGAHRPVVAAGPLSERLDSPFWFDTTRYPAFVDIRVAVPGGVMRVLAPRDRAFATQGHIFVLWMTVATILLTTIAILFIRNQVRAIERLANAAEAFGRGGDVPAFKPHGAREVRRAATAFLDMRARIQRHIDQRTTLLASVSHDLRTPLTRLKLALALSEPSKRNAAMKGDLAEMEHMIDEYLAFARGEGGEAVETVNLRALIEQVSEGAVHAGAKVVVTADPELSVQVRPNALKRALSNAW